MSTSNKKEERAVYCVCQSSWVEGERKYLNDGTEMITCSNISCKKSFHIQCLKLDREYHSADWYCQACSRNIEKEYPESVKMTHDDELDCKDSKRKRI